MTPQGSRGTPSSPYTPSNFLRIYRKSSRLQVPCNFRRLTPPAVMLLMAHKGPVKPLCRFPPVPPEVVALLLLPAVVELPCPFDHACNVTLLFVIGVPLSEDSSHTIRLWSTVAVDLPQLIPLSPCLRNFEFHSPAIERSINCTTRIPLRPQMDS